jgi:hypothetical protein
MLPVLLCLRSPVARQPRDSSSKLMSRLAQPLPRTIRIDCSAPVTAAAAETCMLPWLRRIVRVKLGGQLSASTVDHRRGDLRSFIEPRLLPQLKRGGV